MIYKKVEPTQQGWRVVRSTPYEYLEVQVQNGGNLSVYTGPRGGFYSVTVGDDVLAMLAEALENYRLDTRAREAEEEDFVERVLEA